MYTCATYESWILKTQIWKVTTCLLLLFSILLSFHGWFSLDDRVRRILLNAGHPSWRTTQLVSLTFLQRLQKTNSQLGYTNDMMVFTACWMYNWEWHENQGPLWTGKTLEPNFWDNLLSSTVGCTQWTCRWRRRCGRRRTLRSTWKASARWARRTRFTSSPTTSGVPSSSSCRSATWPSRTNSPHANELKLNYYQILPKPFNPNYLVRRPILRHPDYSQKQATIKTDSSPKSCQY